MVGDRYGNGGEPGSGGSKISQILGHDERIVYRLLTHKKKFYAVTTERLIV